MSHGVYSSTDHCPGVQGVQERYAPSSICFGCGPTNADGLRISSDEGSDGSLVARFTPETHHHAFPGVVSGGILATLLDCHANWTAAMALKRAGKLAQPPPTVTAEITVKMRKPTPMRELLITAKPVEVKDDRCWVEATISPSSDPDLVTATARGLFVAVKPGHPAYHRWSRPGAL